MTEEVEPVEIDEDLIAESAEAIWSTLGPGATESLYAWLTWDQCVDMAKTVLEIAASSGLALAVDLEPILTRSPADVCAREGHDPHAFHGMDATLHVKCLRCGHLLGSGSASVGPVRIGGRITVPRSALERQEPRLLDVLRAEVEANTIAADRESMRRQIAEAFGVPPEAVGLTVTPTPRTWRSRFEALAARIPGVHVVSQRITRRHAWDVWDPDLNPEPMVGRWYVHIGSWLFGRVADDRTGRMD